MIVNIDINNVSGISPHNVFICQEEKSCYYIGQIFSVPYKFEIPKIINNSGNLYLKIIDSEGCEGLRPILIPNF